MKETNFRKKDIRYLHFEVVRLRTMYDSQPEIRDRVVKRYRLLVKEYERRGLAWFWTKHILDKLIKVKKKKEKKGAETSGSEGAWKPRYSEEEEEDKKKREIVFGPKDKKS